MRVPSAWRLSLGGAFVVTQVLLACASADSGTAPSAIDRGLATQAAADADVADAIAIEDATVIDGALEDAAISDGATPDGAPPADASVPTDAAAGVDATTDGATSPPTTNPTPGSSSGTSGAVTAPEFDGSFGSPGKPNDQECTMAPGHARTRPGYLVVGAMLGLAVVLRRRRR